MRLTIPRLLILAALAACFLPSVGSAQIGACSDDFCANVPPDHECECSHCPGVYVECSLRYTCPSFGGFTVTGSKESLTVLAPTTAEDTDKLREAESTPSREEEPQSSKAPQPVPTREGEAR